MKRIITLFTICSCICGMSFAQTAALNGGRIEPRQLTVQDTTSVILYSTEAASGGSAPIVYSWESSADALAWFSVPDATSESCESRPASGGIYYRRKATSGDRIAYSNTVALSANNAIGVTNDTNYIVTYTYTAKTMRPMSRMSITITIRGIRIRTYRLALRRTGEVSSPPFTTMPRCVKAVNTCRMLRAALRGFIVRTPFRNRPNITTVSMERVLIPIWSICMITHR